MMLCSEDLTDLFEAAGLDPDMLTPGLDAASLNATPATTKDSATPPVVEGQILPDSPTDFFASDIASDVLKAVASLQEAPPGCRCDSCCCDEPFTHAMWLLECEIYFGMRDPLPL